MWQCDKELHRRQLHLAVIQQNLRLIGVGALQYGGAERGSAGLDRGTKDDRQVWYILPLYIRIASFIRVVALRYTTALCPVTAMRSRIPSEIRSSPERWGGII